MFAVQQDKQRQENQLSDAERGELVLSCESLCRKLAQKAVPYDDNTSRRSQKIEDMTSEAFLACVEAAKYFEPPSPGNPSKAAKFSTVATNYITKKLKRIQEDERKAAQCGTGANWDLVPEENDEEDYKLVVDEPGSNDLKILGSLAEPARSVVRLMVFEKVPPDRVATQLGMETKDVKLIVRNSIRALAKAKAALGEPDLLSIFDDE